MNVLRLLAASSLAFAAISASVLGCKDESKPSAEPTEEDASASSPDTRQPEVDGAVDPGVAAAIAAFSNDFAEAACARTTTCCGPAEEYATALSMFNEVRFNPDSMPGEATTPSKAGCMAELRKRITSLTDRYARSVQQGRMTFDGQRARKCVDDVKAAPCGPEVVATITTNACIDGRRSAVFKKVAKPGAACADLRDGTLLGDCNPELGFCARMVQGKGKDASVDRTGTCRAWPKAGEACGPDKDARYIVYCNTLKGADCTDFVGGQCTREGKTLAVGDACDSPSGTPIDTCPSGSYCGSEVDGGVSSCLPQKADGEPCSELAQCKTHLPFSCARPLDGGDFVCGERRFCAR